MKTGDAAPSQGRVGIPPWEKLILKYAEKQLPVYQVPQDWLKSGRMEGIEEGESMSTDYVAALAAHDRLCWQLQSCQSRGCSSGDADVGPGRVHSPAEHHLFKAAVRSDALLLGDQSPGMRG